MSNILIVGGGFAGVWAAASAARLRSQSGVSAADLSITLVAPGDDLVIRPRLYQAHPEDMRVPYDRVLGPIGVDRMPAIVTGIDTGRQQVTAVTRDGRVTDLSYDRLVLATGSKLVRPDLPGADHLYDIDTLPAAAALDAHLRRLPRHPAGPDRFTAVVVGAGFAGLEIATELVDRLRAVAQPHGADDEVRVVLVERADVIGPDLGAGPRPEIMQALSTLGIEQRLGVSLRGLSAHSAELTDGTVLPTRTVVWTAGMRASLLTSDIPAPRDRLGRLRVDQHLRVVGVPGVYAAGDTAAPLADETHHVLQSCQHASPQGKFAGHNVAADVLGLAPEPFAPAPYVTCLDLGSAGAVYTTGWDRAVELTAQAAKDLKRTINEVWIYPPVDDAEKIMASADPWFAYREAEAELV